MWNSFLYGQQKGNVCYVYEINKKWLMGNKNIVSWLFLMSLYSWKNLFMVQVNEAIKPSSPKEALKFGKKLLKRVNYGNFFLEMCRKITAAYMALD